MSLTTSAELWSLIIYVQYFLKAMAQITSQTDLKSFEPRQANLCLRAFRHDKF